MTTQHPAVGTKFEWDQASGDWVARTIVKVEGRSIYTEEGGNWGTLAEFHEAITKGDIRNIAPVPSKAPDMCKAPEWCGYLDGDSKDPRRAIFMDLLISATANAIYQHHRNFCSPACANTFVPPLESKPAEPVTCHAPYWCGRTDPMHQKTNWCSLACRDARKKPAETGKHAFCIHCGERPQVARMSCELCLREDEQTEGAELGHVTKVPPAQEAPKVPICLECDKAAPNVCWRVTRNGRELLCDICMVRQEEQVNDLMMFERTGEPYAGPERIDRRLAHQASSHDDDLVGR